MRWIGLIILIFLGCNGKPDTEGDAEPREEVDEMQDECAAPAGRLPDRIVAPNGELTAYISFVETGRVSVEVRAGSEDSGVLAFTNDLVDLYWLPDSGGLVYSVAPIYDAPGIFIRKVAADSPVTLVEPQVVDEAYPEGADWIRLCGVEQIGPETWIRFANFGDVDDLNFRNPPSPTIQRMRISGFD